MLLTSDQSKRAQAIFRTAMLATILLAIRHAVELATKPDSVVLNVFGVLIWSVSAIVTFVQYRAFKADQWTTEIDETDSGGFYARIVEVPNSECFADTEEDAEDRAIAAALRAEANKYCTESLDINHFERRLAEQMKDPEYAASFVYFTKEIEDEQAQAVIRRHDLDNLKIACSLPYCDDHADNVDESCKAQP